MSGPRPLRIAVVARTAASRAALVLLATLGIAPHAGCRGFERLERLESLDGEATPFATRPLHRTSGPRLPPFSGADPSARGWAKVEGLLWIDADAVEAYRAGEVFDGTARIPRDRPLPPGTPPESGFLLRTDHVALRTNLPWSEGLRIARLAEEHVAALFERYGDALDLRLPNAPLSVLAFARRSEFDARLRRHVAEPVSWGAFYESRSGTVYVSHEPAPKGPLPLEADLRHELTHQVLDLSTPDVGRGRIFAGLHFWMWEGLAVHVESLGDPPDRPANAERLARFSRRLAVRDITPLETLLRLPQTQFEGKHYDQTASLMRYLMDGAAPNGRAAVLATMNDLLRGRAGPEDFERRLGRPIRDLEAGWLAWAGGR